MSIKYGELTIIFNKEEITLFTNCLMWLNYEEKPPKKSKYVFLFDDGEICDSDKFKDFNFNFCINNLSGMPPLSFEKEIKKQKTYFYKHPIKDENNIRLLDFNKLFKSYSKYKFNIRIASVFNSIYYCHKYLLKSEISSNPEIFGIIRIKSNEYMPRFLFAYDSDEFTKEEIIYLIHSIFK
jgi:hypothetical protein